MTVVLCRDDHMRQGIKMAHTEGPWTARESHNKPGRYEIRPTHPTPGYSFGYAPLAYVHGDLRVTCGDGKANALLISAAPELLEFAHQYVEHFRKFNITNAGSSVVDATGFLHELAKAAIAKATGHEA